MPVRPHQVLLIPIIALLCACASIESASTDPEAVQGLVRMPATRVDTVLAAPGVSLARYRLLILDPVDIGFEEGWEQRNPGLTADDLTRIVTRSASLLGVPIDPASASELARRSRGTPRVANRLLKRVRDYAQVRAGGAITAAVAAEALKRLDVDEFGLDDMDARILKVIIEQFDGGPVGVQTIAAAVGEDPGTLEEFRTRDVDRADIPAGGFMMAVADATGEVVGYASLMFIPGSTTRGFHDMTAVRRAWRGRGVGRALKQATIGWAIRSGLSWLETGNEDRNTAMRTLNERLGYRAQPDEISFRGPIGGATIDR